MNSSKALLKSVTSESHCCSQFVHVPACLPQEPATTAEAPAIPAQAESVTLPPAYQQQPVAALGTAAGEAGGLGLTTGSGSLVAQSGGVVTSRGTAQLSHQLPQQVPPAAVVPKSWAAVQVCEQPCCTTICL
jgi:hypothetical protein